MPMESRVPVNWHARFGKQHRGNTGQAVRPCADFTERVSEKSGRKLRRWMPGEQLQYAQVEKKRRRRKIVAVTTRVVYGTKEVVTSALAKVGHKINTAFIERLNRTLRSHVPGLGRREEGLAKTKAGLLGRLKLVMGYYNLPASFVPPRRCSKLCQVVEP